jgi:hypothetical protein
LFIGNKNLCDLLRTARGDVSEVCKNDFMSLVKSKKRVADHGEVFTPDWLVEDMLDLVKDETARIESRFLEPACGDGNFLVPVLKRKLLVVNAKYGKNDFENRQYALYALMSIYGVEILEDNLQDCRRNLLSTFVDLMKLKKEDILIQAANTVLNSNIVHGDALDMTERTEHKQSIVFPEWTYLGKGKFSRRDFRFATLTQMSSFTPDTLFGDIGKHEIFAPVKDHPIKSIEEIANGY